MLPTFNFIYKQILMIYSMIVDFLNHWNPRNYFIYEKKDIPVKKQSNLEKNIRVGLLTNEIPPIVYGGVATWVVNFIEMFKYEDRVEIIPIYLAYNDKLPDECRKTYSNIRVIENPEDIRDCFDDIDICINNLWIALDTIYDIKTMFPNMNIVSVCHSLIRMENITNLGSCYTSNFNQQEITFQNSDYVVLISKAEEDYYKEFGYGLFNTKTRVIYNSYVPKYDDTYTDVNYDSNTLGYIGRHVPRKRPEIPIVSVNKHSIENVNVINMGVDYDRYGNAYWKKIEKIYDKNLKIIPFTSDKEIKENYWKQVGINCITGIYEPFGYTICECLDRRIPVIVSNIDGPKEIIEEVKDYVYTYEVDVDNYDNDIDNFTETLQSTLKVDPEIRKENAEKARMALDKLRPEVIKLEWLQLMDEIVTNI